MNDPNPNRSVSDVAVISLGGRFLAFIGRTLYIGRFGAVNPLLNAFTYALHIPQMLFSIVAAALNSVMIPLYSGLLAEEKHEEANRFINNIINIVIGLLIIFVFTGILAAPLVSRIVGGADFTETAYLTFSLRVLMPAMFFFSFGAIFTGLLQSHGSFRLPALVSAPGGAILILYVILFGDRFGVTGLLFATLLGVAMQPLIMIPAIRKLGYRYSFSIDLKNENIRAAGRLCIPALISVVSYQAHFIFANSMALRMGYAAVMDYAQQMVQVFIIIIVLAVAAVYLPRLSALWAKKNRTEYNENLKNAFSYIIFLVLPAACGLVLLRYEIMDFLLNWRGEGDTRTAGILMGLYAVGIVSMALKEIADRAFYSMKDAKTPAVFGIVIMACNIAVTIALIPRLGVYAMPTAYAVAAAIGTSGLLVRLQIKVRFIDRSLVWETAKAAVAVAVMAVGVYAVKYFVPVANRLLAVALPALMGVAVYFVMARLLRCKAITERMK
ncbi:MAG: polysaccharide biosynthesis C-terminal domain-containing protein [Defluviitaleaceae bacterium]|nr:polysaccharide biosynthesis C-terminal domain-containing protein [Defluviitaleaceae bacterium]